MESKQFLELVEAYSAVYAPQEVEEATAMAKRGLDEPAIRKQIAAKTKGGESADKATALADKQTYGQSGVDPKARQRLAATQRGDFRKTASSNPGLHGYAHKATNPADKAKQDARGAQRGVLTPNEKKTLNREEVESWVNGLIEEGYDLSEYTWDDMYEMYVSEAMTSYEKNRQRAAQRAAARNEARKQGKTGNVPGVGYVSPRPERETWRDEGGQERHKTGARMPQKEEYDIFEVVLEFLCVEGYAETLEEAEWMMANIIDEEAIGIILGEDNVNEIFGLGGKSAKDRLANSDYMKKKNKETDEKAIQNLKDMMSKDPERQKRPSRINNEGYQRNPEKGEKEDKKYAPVRGEKTPMPPRGDKRREDFEKWYAANVR